MNVIRSTHTVRASALAAAAAISMAFTGTASAVTPIVRVVGPPNATFYTPSSNKVSGGSHGDLIWYRTADAANQLTNASASYSVVYKSKSLKNKSIAVSGMVWVPKGTAPAGGWPVISWGHGTSGSADACAPSRNAQVLDPANIAGTANYTNYVYPQFNSWLSKGYAVVQTDYEGLGTSGIHPYLIGHSEARGMIDIVLAARKLVPALSTKWFASGHSQGGHAALFAASDGPTWAPGLQLKGVAAFAPANNLKATVGFAAGAFWDPKTQKGTPNGISGLGALLIRSTSIADTTIRLSSAMTPAAYALMGQLEQKCIGDTGLGAPTSFGQFAPNELLRGWNGLTWTNATAAKGIRALDSAAMNPNQKISVPILILQGITDSTVPAPTTNYLVNNQMPVTNPTTPLTYKTYAGVGHGPVVAAGENDATAFFNANLN